MRNNKDNMNGAEMMTTKLCEVIPYNPTEASMVKNMDQLPRGCGARYLEVIRSHVVGEFIAKQWRRHLIPGALLIDFKPESTN